LACFRGLNVCRRPVGRVVSALSSILALHWHRNRADVLCALPTMQWKSRAVAGANNCAGAVENSRDPLSVLWCQLQ